MAKQSKKAKRTKPRNQTTPAPTIQIIVPAPSHEDLKRARDLLRQRADTLVLELAKRYSASNAAELTTVLDAMDSLSELENLTRSQSP